MSACRRSGTHAHIRTHTHPPTHTQPPAAPARADRTGSKDATAVKAEKAPPTAERQLSPKVAEKFATESAETASTCSLRLSRGERVLDQTGGRPCRLQCYATKGSIPPDASDASPPPPAHPASPKHTQTHAHAHALGAHTLQKIQHTNIDSFVKAIARRSFVSTTVSAVWNSISGHTKSAPPCKRNRR